MNLAPVPHGQAALMLVESLMMLFVEEDILLPEHLVDAIETVVEVKQEIAGTSESVVVSMASIGLLRGCVAGPLGCIPFDYSGRSRTNRRLEDPRPSSGLTWRG